VQLLSVNVMSFTEAFGTTWTKHYCTYHKDTKQFRMIPYNQMTGKFVSICCTCELYYRIIDSVTMNKNKYFFLVVCNN